MFMKRFLLNVSLSVDYWVASKPNPLIMYHECVYSFSRDCKL